MSSLERIVRGFGYARSSFVQQKNVVAIFVTVILSAVAYGWIEGTQYPFYPLKDELVIANHFTWYHVVFLFLFLIIGFSLSVSRALISGLRNYYLLFASLGSLAWGFWVEDMAYFSTRYPTEVLQPGVWVEWGLPGFHFLRHWIPNVYVILCSGGFLLYGFAFLMSRQDPLAKAIRSKTCIRQVAHLIRSKWMPLLIFAIAVQSANLIAASLTNIANPTLVPLRLGLMLLVVLVIPLLLLLVLDNLPVKGRLFGI